MLYVRPESRSNGERPVPINSLFATLEMRLENLRGE